MKRDPGNEVGTTVPLGDHPRSQSLRSFGQRLDRSTIKKKRWGSGDENGNEDERDRGQEALGTRIGWPGISAVKHT